MGLLKQKGFAALVPIVTVFVVIIIGLSANYLTNKNETESEIAEEMSE